MAALRSCNRQKAEMKHHSLFLSSDDALPPLVCREDSRRVANFIDLCAPVQTSGVETIVETNDETIVETTVGATVVLTRYPLGAGDQAECTGDSIGVTGTMQQCVGNNSSGLNSYGFDFQVAREQPLLEILEAAPGLLGR